MSKKGQRIPETVIYCCCGSKCKKNGAKQIFKDLKAQVKENKLKHKVQVIKTGCTDRCKWGPVIAVMPENKWHLEVDSDQADKIFAHLVTND